MDALLIGEGKVMRKSLRVMLCLLMVCAWVMADAAPAAAADVENWPVPYIHQQDDPPDDPYAWSGSYACGAASAVMLAAYWGKLPPHPCGLCNSNDYSWYVNQRYTNSYGTYFDTPNQESGGNTFWGAYGYIYSGTVLDNVESFLEAHGLVCAIDTTPTEAEVKAELDAGYPVYKHTTIGDGHEIVIRGYTNDVSTKYIVNDPLWGEDIPYLWASIRTGSMITVHPSTDQTWYLDDTSADGNYFMYREDTTQTAATVEIANLAQAKWRADEAADGDVSFPAGDWNVFVHLDPAPDNNDDFTGKIGMFDYWGSGGSWQSPDADWQGDGTTQDFQATLSLGSFTVDDGKHLWFGITNMNNTGPPSLQLKVGSTYSVVISPATDPGYPVPELPTIVLVTVGLVMLGGYYVVGRRRLNHKA